MKLPDSSEWWIVGRGRKILPWGESTDGNFIISAEELADVGLTVEELPFPRIGMGGVYGGKDVDDSAPWARSFSWIRISDKYHAEWSKILEDAKSGIYKYATT